VLEGMFGEMDILLSIQRRMALPRGNFAAGNTT